MAEMGEERWVLDGSKIDTSVYKATDDEMRGWVQGALAKLGLTFDELADLSRSRFQTEDQRRTWFAIKDLGRFA